MWRIVQAALLGMMVYLFINGASSIMDASCGESLVGWAGRQVHDKLAKPGDALGLQIHGEENWAMIRPDIRAAYVLASGLIVGFVVGGMVGLAKLIWSRRIKPTETEPANPNQPALLKVPANWPLGVALIGILFYGHLLGLLAVVLLRRSQAGWWLRCATWVVALGVALLWGAGQELWFGEGWSTIYPWARIFYLVR